VVWGCPNFDAFALIVSFSSTKQIKNTKPMMKGMSQKLYELSVMKVFCMMIKKSGIPIGSFYQFLRFNGEFKVMVADNTFFYLIHNGGIIENEIFWKGLFQTWEKDIGWLWKELCVCSEVIVDVGANKGIYSLVAKALNPAATVYAFEPSMKTIEQLKINFKRNEFDIITEQIALSDSEGKKIFYDVPHKNQSSASLSSKKLKDNDLYKGEIFEYEVQAKKMSTYIEEKDITQIDLIKIDVELHEAEVIDGLGDFLNKFKPVVVLEILRDEVAAKLHKIIDLDNYIMFGLKNQDTVVRCESFYPKKEDGIMNYIFFHKDKEAFMRLHTSLFK